MDFFSSKQITHSKTAEDEEEDKDGATVAIEEGEGEGAGEGEREGAREGAGAEEGCAFNLDPQYPQNRHPTGLLEYPHAMHFRGASEMIFG